MKYSIVIPMYNEAQMIENTIVRLQSFLDTLDGDGEVIFSNDGSRDGCEQTVLRVGKQDPRIRLTGSTENRGKGAAVRQGILASRGDYVLFTDCDIAYGEEQMRGLLRRLTQSPCELVIGSRALHADGYRGYSLPRKLMSKIYHTAVCLLSGFRHSDSQTGLKGFRGDAARKIFALCKIDRFAFDVEALLLAEKMGMQLEEYPVTILQNDGGGRASKVHPLRDACRMLRDIRIIRRELRSIPAPSLQKR